MSEGQREELRDCIFNLELLEDVGTLMTLRAVDGKLRYYPHRSCDCTQRGLTMMDADDLLTEWACASQQELLWRTEFEDLFEPEKVFMSVWILRNEVNNGGFAQYYENSYSENAEFAVTALRALGAHETAGILERANAIFPGARPPRDQTRRNEMLAENWQQVRTLLEDLDTEFFQDPDNLDTLFVHYILDNQEGIRGGDLLFQINESSRR